MNDRLHQALLPAGLFDLLPPDAEHEAETVERFMAAFGRHGFERVKPPLVEFESNLLASVGASMGQQMFRVMDPQSRRMMGLRADMTLQAARIAATRLARAPRPLRLCYSGEVLRVTGSQLRPERQFRQVGCETIGSLAAAADAELITLAASALVQVGVQHLSIDLATPTLVPALGETLGLDAEGRALLAAAIDRRDVASVMAMGGPAAKLVGALMAAAGPAERAIARMAEMMLPAAAEPDRRRLTEVVGLVHSVMPDLPLTVDPVERRGFEYQSGLSFTIFARGVRGELGRGGRYRTGHGGDTADGGEPAVGFTLYMDSVLRALPAPVPARRLYIPFGTDHDRAEALRAEGWVTVLGLEPLAGEGDMEAARRLACDYVLGERDPRRVT